MNSLTELLTQQQTHLTALQDVIMQERDALTTQAAEQLLSLAEQKNALLSALQKTDQLLAAHPDTALLASQHHNEVAQIQSQLAQCQQLNDTNAKLIDLNLASLNRLSQALQLSRNANSLTYDQQGNTSSIATLGNNLKA
ncbi:flagellar protein FlgN [Shewanella sp. NFH-SH190041]|uniref:flagellar export chaperone FlgN n=1 Tax=Shewanella sp. NFH-SH190041 TaxID=2950245 RepID=UPI0021C2C4A9|nr:flagellar export chaperone FlgN [Shewanella sp. NFH-SH190041]BDM63774.1 flagellar protein FlgN [Shewanella sp. NFH-SH190041]